MRQDEIPDLPFWAQAPVKSLFARCAKLTDELDAALLEIARLRAVIKQCPKICGYSDKIKDV